VRGPTHRQPASPFWSLRQVDRETFRRTGYSALWQQLPMQTIHRATAPQPAGLQACKSVFRQHL